jgi:uncharacterized protein (TIGR02594 family)
VPESFSAALADYKELSWSFVNSLTRQQAVDFLSAYATFDGNGADSGQTILYTADRRLRDQLVVVACMAGYHTNLQRHSSPLSGRDCWRIVFSTLKDRRQIKKEHVSSRDFEGPLYCVSVPQERIIVRGPDSGPVVVGNCGAFTARCMMDVGLPYPDRYASALAWASYGEPCGPQLGAIAVLTRRGGGHVGFVTAVSPGGRHVQLLGGNQGDAVNERWFDASRITAYRCPPGCASELGVSPVLALGQMSTSEA